MKILKVYENSPPPRAISAAISMLESDGLIVYPTDTIYGLGCSLHSKKALERLYRIKAMDKKTPLSFIASDLSTISEYALVANKNYRILNRYLPGPFTFILPANRLTNKYMLYSRNEVGIRIPKNSICAALTDYLGYPIVTTSVPLWGEEILNDGEKIALFFANEIDLVLDGGTIISEPSTIVDLTRESPEIVRQGKGIF